MRRGWVVALVFAMAAALPLAHAQQPDEAPPECLAPVLSLASAPDSFAPGGSFTLLFAIENPNDAPIESVRATVTTTAPAGWTATAAQRETTLGPDNITFNALTISAPNRGSGAQQGNITLSVTFVCTVGATHTTASTVEHVPVELGALQPPWPIVLGAFLLLTAGVAVLGVRRLRRGVAILITTPERTLAPGKSAKFTFVVENRRGRPQTFHLLPTGLPPAWTIHLALPEVGLEPGEEKTLWAILKAPPHAVAGEVVEFQLRLENASGGRDRAIASLRARVVDEE